jgi:dGTPase
MDELFGLDERLRKERIGLLVNHFITEALVAELPDFTEPLLRYRVTLPDQTRGLLDALKQAVGSEVISNACVQQLEFKGQMMVVATFEALASDPTKLLPRSTLLRYEAAGDECMRMRVLCDHISGMTDAFLLRIYERLFSPRMGSVFDRL